MQKIIDKAYKRLRFMSIGRNVLSRLFLPDQAAVEADILHVKHKINSLEEVKKLAHPIVYKGRAVFGDRFGYRDCFAHSDKLMYVINNVKRNSITGLLRICDEQIISSEPVLNRKRPIGFVELPFPKTKPVEGLSYLANERNFYHFITEDLANILMVLPFMNGKLRIILPGVITWKEELLKHFLSEDAIELVRVPKYCTVLQKKAVIVNKEPFDSYIHPESIKKIRNALPVEDVNNGDRKKIFISRSKAPSRDIKNGKEVEKKFAEAGYEIVLCEDLSVKKQISLFSSASVIAGAHGAGFTNMIWAPEGCKIIEVFDMNHMNYCYASMASKLGFNYDFLLLNSDGSLNITSLKGLLR